VRWPSIPMVAIVVHLTWPASAGAQTAVSVSLDINVGLMQPVSTAFTQSVKLPFDQAVEADYSSPRGPSLDVAGGILLGERFRVGIGLSHRSNVKKATVRWVVPAGQGFAISPKDSEPLHHSEMATHIDVGYRFPRADRAGVTVFGGPSHFTVKQDLVSYFTLAQTGPLSSAISTVVADSRRGSAWGFNVGADASYRLVGSLGIGGLVRYSRAAVTLPNPLQEFIAVGPTDEAVDVGGLFLGVGLGVRF